MLYELLGAALPTTQPPNALNALNPQKKNNCAISGITLIMTFLRAQHFLRLLEGNICVQKTAAQSYKYKI